MVLTDPRSPGLSKPPPPLLGFNNNVKHRGQVFHIQTEDSGIKRSKIVTHLFADGGRIVRTARTDYAEHVGRADMVEVVRRLMKEQHKSMFIRLRSGELDEEIEWTCSSPPEALAPADSAPSAPEQPEPLPPVEVRKPLVAAASARKRKPERSRLSNPALRRVRPSIPPGAGDLELDVNLLDSTPPRPAGDDDPRRQAALARTRPPPVPKASPSGARVATRSAPPSDAPGRYAASRPAAIFSEMPDPRGSIFGDATASEQSLDDVILSYLADDIDEGKS
jgi:hypothetical protein